jgi:phosphatidylglycerol---prolipoprotein diacylglyceryl transferase
VLPRLFSIGPFTVYSYGALLAVALVLGLLVAAARARRAGLDGARVLDLGVLVIFAGIVGAKLLLLVVDFRSIVARPSEALAALRVGGVFYGGLLTAIGAGAWYMRRHRMPLWSTCDACAPGIAVGHVVGRLGCFAAGCCYGRPTAAPWGVTFHDHFAASYVGTPLGVALHPTQLYESAAEAAILLILLASERVGRRVAGRTFWLYLALYAVSRFVIEFFRGDERGAILGFSTSQAISLAILPCSLAALVLLARSASSHGRTAPAHR